MTCWCAAIACSGCSPALASPLAPPSRAFFPPHLHDLSFWSGGVLLSCSAGHCVKEPTWKSGGGGLRVLGGLFRVWALPEHRLRVPLQLGRVDFSSSRRLLRAPSCEICIAASSWPALVEQESSELARLTSGTGWARPGMWKRVRGPCAPPPFLLLLLYVIALKITRVYMCCAVLCVVCTRAAKTYVRS